MIYLDYGATSFYKPKEVEKAMISALRSCGSVGRGGYPQAEKAAKVVFACREAAAELMDAQPEQIVFTGNCTHSLNIAIRSLVKPGGRVAVSGFEHNAVMRPLYALGAKISVFGRRLFDPEETLRSLEKVLQTGVDAAVFTQVSNVFGYRLPVEEMAALCRRYQVHFCMDAAQGAGSCPISLRNLGADFIAMPGHKGLLGPTGTGILLCKNNAEPFLFGGTGSHSLDRTMPEELPDRLEAGTMNVVGIAGLLAGLRYLNRRGVQNIGSEEARLMQHFGEECRKMGYRVYSGESQMGTVSLVPQEDCETFSEKLAEKGIAVRAGLHCAPLAHESAGTLDTGTVRFSAGPFTTEKDILQTLRVMRELKR